MIKNYTTEVPAGRSLGEITGLLAAKGARRISTEFDAQGTASGISFVLLLQGSPILFKLPCNVEGVFQSLRRSYKDERSRTGFDKNPKSRGRAQRVAWRILKDWVAAQMAIVEAEQAELAEVFLPYVVEQQSGHTMFQLFVEQHCKALPGAS